LDADIEASLEDIKREVQDPVTDKKADPEVNKE
jgi:hypothetical protein